MSTEADFRAYHASREALRRFRRELLTIAERPDLDPQTRRGIRLQSDALAPSEQDLTGFLDYLHEFEPAP